MKTLVIDGMFRLRVPSHVHFSDGDLDTIKRDIAAILDETLSMKSARIALANLRFTLERAQIEPAEIELFARQLFAYRASLTSLIYS